MTVKPTILLGKKHPLQTIGDFFRRRAKTPDAVAGPECLYKLAIPVLDKKRVRPHGGKGEEHVSDDEQTGSTEGDKRCAQQKRSKSGHHRI